MDPFSTSADSIFGRMTHVILSVRALFASAHCSSRHLSKEDCASTFGSFFPTEQILDPIKSNIVNTVQATALVFVHSACENAIVDLIRLICRWDRNAVISKIELKKITLKEARDKSLNSIEQELLDDWLSELEKFSFPKKMDVTLGLISPTTTSDVISGFTYDKNVMIEIDRLRHDKVHNPSFVKEISGINEKLKFLINTVWMSVEIAKQKHAGTVPNRCLSPSV